MVVKENAKLVEELVVIEEQAKGSEERLGGCKRDEIGTVKYGSNEYAFNENSSVKK